MGVEDSKPGAANGSSVAVWIREGRQLMVKPIWRTAEPKGREKCGPIVVEFMDPAAPEVGTNPGLLVYLTQINSPYCWGHFELVSMTWKQRS